MVFFLKVSVEKLGEVDQLAYEQRKKQKKKGEILHIFELLFWMSILARDTRTFSTVVLKSIIQKINVSHSPGDSHVLP